jgi:hypothetical protein
MATQVWISKTGRGFDQKGTKIVGRKGLPNINPDLTKGVEIHDPRHG